MPSPFDDDIDTFAPHGYDFIKSSYIGLRIDQYTEQRAHFETLLPRIVDLSFDDYKLPPVARVPLVDEEIVFEDSLISSLSKRRSVRGFNGQPCTLGQLSFLLKLAAGAKPGRKGVGRAQNRFFPSGGGLYTTRIYVDIRNVLGVKAGVYHFNPVTNSLDVINLEVSNQDRSRLHNGAQSGGVIGKSCFEILISTKPYVATKKYGDHGWRVILMEIGHLTQNLWLVAVACGLSGYPCSSLHPEIASKILRTISSREFLLQSLIIGFEDFA